MPAEIRDSTGGNGMRMSEETANCTVCRQPLGENGRCQHCDDDVTHIWTIQDWRPLLTLGLVIVLGFSFTSLVVNGFNEKQNALALPSTTQAGLHAMDAQQVRRRRWTTLKPRWFIRTTISNTV